MEQNIRIDRLEMDRFEEGMELAQFAFQFVRSPQELEEIRKRTEDEPSDRWAVFVEDRLAAQAVVLELETYIAGKAFAMGGVAAVATWPEYRRQGFVGKLLVHALAEMNKKGQTLSFLHPFAFGFYQKFGWAPYTENKLYTLMPQQLPPRTASPGRIERVIGYDSLYEPYETFAARYNGTLKRTEKWWNYRINVQKPAKIAAYRDSQDIVQGYIIYEVSKKELKVDELVYLNEEARTALWTFIAQHDSMVEKVTLTAPIDDTLIDHLPDPRIKQEVVPYFMARIVDVKGFLEQYPFLPQDEATEFAVQVADEHAPWNNQTFRVKIPSSGQASVTANELDTGGFGENSILRTDIGALTMLMLSYRSGVQLSGSKRIQGDPETINRLQARIPERTTYLPDFF
ncbi:GNAT family N-acetyltransferase [Paenibacillus sp. LHD-117]|uniref:GNAT family N-acetyltransferase n=1 Tax=Paenibacillus sp. LHD-117 TaxID=3071412 RepID=UPI0027E0F7DC|nr:GNAT family N-acetyltransferase [Paenibacillus sp. LHD-117]MDQ6422172.1 GNAT family N-acetyltransferase [Paenibacillus sp. LHD-117]